MASKPGTTKAPSREAADLVRRGRPRREVAPEEKPAASAPAATTPAAPAPEIAWAELGPAVKAILDPLYVALGATPLPAPVWVMFTTSWGGVVDFYLPTLRGTPWPPAIIATCVVLLPIAQVLPEYRRRREEARTKKPPTDAEISQEVRDRIPA